jgi:hypothetical protein
MDSWNELKSWAHAAAPPVLALAASMSLDKGDSVRRIVFSVLVASLLLGLSPLSAAPVIQRGIDVFTTVGDGRTFYDFSQNPVPAGFFCERSKAFTGRVALKGLPLATQTPGQLRGADTVVERLDNAVLDDKGVGMTRTQFRALSLVSSAPIKTACGAFHVYVSLGGKQRVTTMSILRTQEGGGTFIAPLAVDVRMTFIPVKPAKKGTKKLEIKGSITFPAISLPWSLAADKARGTGAVVVDTNGDLTPDTLLPGTSNFRPGQSPGRPGTDKFYGGGCPSCAEVTCHAYATEDEHCFVSTPPDCQIVDYCPY